MSSKLKMKDIKDPFCTAGLCPRHVFIHVVQFKGQLTDATSVHITAAVDARQSKCSWITLIVIWKAKAELPYYYSLKFVILGVFYSVLYFCFFSPTLEYWLWRTLAF